MWRTSDRQKAQGYPSSKKDFAIFPSQGTLQVRARVPFKSKGLPYFNQGTLQVKIRVPFKSKRTCHISTRVPFKSKSGYPSSKKDFAIFQPGYPSSQSQGTLQVKRTLPCFQPGYPSSKKDCHIFYPGYPSSQDGPNFQPGYPSSLHSEMLPVLGLDTSRLRDGTHRATWD